MAFSMDDLLTLLALTGSLIRLPTDQAGNVDDEIRT